MIRVLRVPGGAGGPASGSTSFADSAGGRGDRQLAAAGPGGRDAGIAVQAADRRGDGAGRGRGRARSGRRRAVRRRAPGGRRVRARRAAQHDRAGSSGWRIRNVLSFCWVVDFPMFEPNEETGGWDFSHNPFSMPQGGLAALQSMDPGRHPGLPVRPGVQRGGAVLRGGAQPPARGDGGRVRHRRLRAGAGRPSFPALWNAFHYGPPPHAGIAPGFDRILMLLEDQANLREVIAFPLNQAAGTCSWARPARCSTASWPSCTCGWCRRRHRPARR